MSSIESFWFNTKGLIHSYGLTAFIETGCDKGVSLGWAREFGLSPLWTCDINDEHCEIARQHVPTANIVHSDSLTFLAKYLEQRKERTLFWLDAHFPEYWGTPGTQEQQYPVYEELKLIKALKPGYEHDVIMVDDIRVIESHDNPIQFRSGGVPAETRAFNDFTTFFEDTHYHQVFTNDTGSLIFLPKHP